MQAARLHEYTEETSEALRIESHDLADINTVAERLEHNEIEGRADVLPP